MSKPKILIQLDGDQQPSVFDAVVAVDAGADFLFRHGAVQPGDVRGLVHGAIFTRGPDELRRTAIFIGGSNVAAGEELLRQAKASFFGPFSVSILMDANGANTTAAAAVLAARAHVPLQGAKALVLGGTGPVGQRAVRLLAGEGAEVLVGSRSVERAAEVCRSVAANISGTKLTPVAAGSPAEAAQALAGMQIVIAAGAAGVELLTAEARSSSHELAVAIDLNAVPPLGLTGVEATDRAKTRDGVICYGALGVGGTKMKIHKAALRRLFKANDQVFDAEEIYQLGRELFG
ncbi:MAG: NAD(P)-dependent methylenetetrahydromethanopterin dehydrogenase [Pirellulales bacterium]